MPGKTVLVVDDDPVIQKLLQVNFELEGYTVITAGDGVEGLARARADRPDAIILDIMMPRMNGLDVARALKADPELQATPLLLLSARSNLSVPDRAEMDQSSASASSRSSDPFPSR